jgi:vancomycin resistance protein YoaR
LENPDKSVNKVASPANQQKTKVVKFLVISLFVCLLGFSFYHGYYADKIIPGVYVGNIHLGGKTIPQATQTLTGHLTKEHVLKLNDSEKDTVYEIKTQAIELEYDIENTVNKTFKIGRTKKFLPDLITKIASPITKPRVQASVEYNQTLLGQRLNQIKGSTDEPAQDAEIFLNQEQELEIKPHKAGRKTNNQILEDIVLTSFETLDYSQKELPIEPHHPEYKTEDLRGLDQEIEALLEKGLKINYGNQAREASPEEILNLVGAKKDAGVTRIEVRAGALESFATRMEKEITTPPRAQVTEETPEGEVLDIEITQTGTKLNLEKFKAALREALLSGGGEVTAKIEEGSERISPEDYGIVKLLGRGESDYTGSAPGRAHNLNLAAEKASGVLVGPGENYSLNEAVGPINSGTGYSQAWVIAQGRTVLGSGGGVCQTSTTLFRAILNSGLPVVERHSHAYRVGYYENDKPVGFDAAIYQPALDFKFKNDTENYVLVQAEFLKQQNKLAFRIYGTPDGRQVEITDPIVTGITPPPEPLYEETDTLKKGTTEQIDFAAWGATSVFSRTVTREGETLFEETYRNVYRPWRAIYLVGTAD